MKKEIGFEKVSIITPIYNGEFFIKKCYECVCKQTYSNIEWVVINDGSQDASLLELEEVSKKFPNLLIIDQENSGAAEARRAGASLATGDYVVYLDIDDALASDAIQLAMDKFTEDIDVVLFKQIRVGYGVSKPFVMFTEIWPQKGVDVFRACIDGWGAHSAGIYRKSVFLHGYHFLDNFKNISHTYKDELLSRIIFSQSRAIDNCNGEYLYDLNDGSVSKKYNPDYFEIANNVHALKSYLDAQSLNISIERFYCRLFFDLFSRYLKWRKKLVNKPDWQLALINLVTNISLSSELQDSIKKNKIIKSLPRLSILTCFKIIAIIRKTNA